MTTANLLLPLDYTPVLGVPLENVCILRLDRSDSLAPGNKWYKLQGSLAEAQRLGVRRLVSFGGAWSNHLHALAAVGREQDYETVGLVRGEPGEADTATLADARRWGMRLERVARREYRRRNDPDYLQAVAERFAPCLVIPEGGANEAGVAGCLAIAALLRDVAPPTARVVVAVGTGTTLAGIAAGLGPEREVIGVSALKGATDLEARVRAALAHCDTGDPARWSILHDFHCGGFARVSDALREFIAAFERAHGVLLDPVYTAKAMFAIHCKLKTGEWDATEPIVMVHTGGLQGRRGFSFL
jgi:1-aminocyclopropane-1-carboxylate deaminase